MGLGIIKVNNLPVVHISAERPLSLYMRFAFACALALDATAAYLFGLPNSNLDTTEFPPA